MGTAIVEDMFDLLRQAPANAVIGRTAIEKRNIMPVIPALGGNDEIFGGWGFFPDRGRPAVRVQKLENLMVGALTKAI